MFLYHYFKARDGLPDTKGSLLRSVSSAAIHVASVNREVQRVIIVTHLPIASHELAGARSSRGGFDCKNFVSG